MQKFIVELAKESDDLSLKRILCTTPMEGDIKVAFQREPSYFCALETAGKFNQTIVARDTKTNDVVGMGTRSIKPAYVNGEITPIGYLNSLRIDKRYRNRTLLNRGYTYFRQLHQDKRTQIYLSTIIQDNEKVRQLLTSKRVRLPLYHDIGECRTFAIKLVRKKRGFSKRIAVSKGTNNDLGGIVECLNRNGKEKQFYPYYTKADFRSDKRYLKDFKIEDFYVARVQGKIVGVIGKWDQSGFKQTLISGYSRKIKLIRPVYNHVAKIFKYPQLPEPGKHLTFFYVSFIAIDDNDPNIFAALVRALYNDSVDSKYSYMMIGLFQKDPLLSVIKQYASIEYKSRIYVVCWDDGEHVFKTLDGRIPYLEISTL
ncbi:MAG: hypothetical protein GXO98_05255 [Nitrospirae bacterium]|nr:hypothetical protein [Nitrospirota bacterium]